ncbi:hypothetical protein D0U04_08785 [Bacillus clarus]|uniref:Uncharacterized protein n=1 Tax=Bacillus clarus TaxID=2338372 RepID=A0A090YLA4_9BACI|nr:hypothetical protein [Bacillus clarus]KFM99001.1 hypothetical protein DJ93_1184 [Bacillus clarus]RFT67198.1 hypothetical protein D0U04_08785 [Bacillus clarus]
MCKTTEIIYREPGEGAIDFAKQFMGDLTRDEALPIVRRLLKGRLHGEMDKRVKRCAYCGYFYRDKTRPNNSKTCCSKCKVGLDTLRRSIIRADKALLNPKKPKAEKCHLWWLEYPFYVQEYEMLKNTWKYEVPYSPDKLTIIHAAKQRDEMIGGKRKPKRIVPYIGWEEEID